MKIKLNGSILEIAHNLTLATLIAQQTHPKNNFACAVNLQFIPKISYQSYQLQPGDEIEIVSAMQGG